MKTITLFFFAAILNVPAQYAIDWFTIDGGGGQSSGGAYTLVGTIGQPEAATSSGGAYTLEGGFWSAFPTEDGPSIRIFHAEEKLVLAWPNPSTGFQLQLSPSLTAPAWTNVNDVPMISGGEKQVSQPLESGARFYRLRKP